MCAKIHIHNTEKKYLPGGLEGAVSGEALVQHRQQCIGARDVGFA